MTRVGCHVGAEDPVGQALAVGADAMQIFIGDPQGWKTLPVAMEPGPVLAEKAKSADIDIYVHAPYVINVASPNNRIRVPSRRLLQEQLDAAALFGAKGLVVHGGHVTTDEDPAVGYDNWRKAASRLELRCPLFIENTAGGRNAMARTLEAMARLRDAVGEYGIGCCIDTCHAWAAGIDLPDGIDAIRAVTGRIDLVHANDSEGAFGSGRDRHRNLGDGTIGADRIVEACARAAAPVICETAAPGVANDIAMIRARLDGVPQT